MKKRKLKLKKQVYYFIIGIILIIVLSIVGKKHYEDYKYRQTYEYKLLEIGYTKDETIKLLDLLNDSEINQLLLEEKNEDLLHFIDEKYFLYKNLKEYLEYKDKYDNLSYSNIVTIVNVNRNHEYYTDDHDTNLNLNYSLLTNKYYKLASDYEPEDLVTVKTTHAWGDYGDNKIRQEVYDEYIKMFEAAKENGITLMINSSYRSFQDQEAVYKSYEEEYDTDYADDIAARPGYSEHQTGLALDIFCTTNTSIKTFENSEAFKWLSENSYKYGFILRYPKEKENITGYTFESWHYRYVGKELAYKIYQEKITLDEYYAYYIEK